MNDKGNIIGYKLIPITKEDFFGMQVCMGTSCCITKFSICGSGLMKDVIHPLVVDLLKDDRTIQSLVKIRLAEVRAGL